MEKSEALKIFRIASVEELKKVDIKKVYRNLMLKNHPDIGGTEEAAKSINEAYVVISKALNNQNKTIVRSTEKTKEKVIQIDIKDYIEICKNNPCKKEEIKKSKTLINIPFRISLNGDIEDCSITVLRNSSDIYKISKQLKVRSLQEYSNIKIGILDKEININTKEKVLHCIFNLEYNIKIDMLLERAENKKD